MNPLNHLPAGWKENIYSGVSAAFNNHPKMTTITLVALGAILLVAIIFGATALGFNPFSISVLEFAMIPTAMVGIGISYGAYLYLNKKGDKKGAAVALMVTRVAAGILLASGGMFLFGHGVTGMLAAQVPNFTSLAWTTVSFIGGGGAIAGGLYLAGTGMSRSGEKSRQQIKKRQRRNASLQAQQRKAENDVQTTRATDRIKAARKKRKDS